MALLKWLAIGTLGVIAYRAWRQHAGHDVRMDDGARTSPHGDAILVGETIDLEPAPVTGVQSSRGFGEP
jgi:hypothetical protein